MEASFFTRTLIFFVAMDVDKLKRIAYAAASKANGQDNLKFEEAKKRKFSWQMKIYNFDAVNITRFVEDVKPAVCFIQAPNRTGQYTSQVDVYVPMQSGFGWWMSHIVSSAISLACALAAAYTLGSRS